MNLETGRKEAKKLSKEDSESSGQSICEHFKKICFFPNSNTCTHSHHWPMMLTEYMFVFHVQNFKSFSTGVGENRLAIKDDSIVDLGIVDDNLDKLEEGLKRAANSDYPSETIAGKFRTIEELKK